MAVISRDEAIDKFDTYLNDVYGNVKIANHMFSTAQALKYVDEILYQEMFNEWCNDYGYSNQYRHISNHSNCFYFCRSIN